ncbi:hypothetical protein L593_11300 [Salinarchaeum sp. Harcht-Bsk1]|uniref:GNAT family N-acetyltransferase n=1 Tax=Salinarchaeum sp. Harcht-Bsk1 TaxID=1333523 RepID=UPI00034246B3|nr:GNAT family N-acetyltransferase [Salinarchaeum sp. Harcht-Bsk1]AGN02205.1 hypothetical protein L593_11300 [Salinarchaeum sp. Harcht-Bsk1]
MDLHRLTLDEWADALPSGGFEPFHHPDALSALEAHSQGELRCYGGFKGQQPVALLPAIVQDRSVGRAILSPPPGKGIPRLGPVLDPASPKQRKREKVNRTFAELVLDDLAIDGRGTLFRMTCNADYVDPRPYVWSDLELDTSFTYRLDTDGEAPGAIRKNFSKSLRREIGDAEDLPVTVEREGIDGAEAIYEDTRRRYNEQDRPFRLSWPYVGDLFTGLGDRARAYVVRGPDGEFLSGITALYSNDAAYYWQGGARATFDGTAVNSLVHWRILEDLATNAPHGATTYDLMGANTERLCRYKSKFGAELVPYYVVESGGAGMDVAKKAYSLVAR